MESAADSLNLVTTPVLRKALKDAGVSGLSGAKTAEPMRRVPPSLPAQLEDAVSIRSYKLTTSGQALLDTHLKVVAKHPRKS